MLVFDAVLRTRKTDLREKVFLVGCCEKMAAELALCDGEVQDFLRYICGTSYDEAEDLVINAHLYEMADIYEFGAEEYSSYWQMLGDEICKKCKALIVEMKIFVS